MGILSTNAGVILIYASIAAVIDYNDAATSTGRTYGTWVDRRRDRECKRSLVCEYRQADCLNNSPQNQWRCTAITNSMQAKMCSLQICEKTQGMMCLVTDPGENMTEVESNTCAIGQKCYAPLTMTTLATSGTTPPAVTFEQTTGVPGTTNDLATEMTTASQMSTATSNMTTPSVNETVATTDFPDENATDIIWSSAIQGNSTPPP